MATTNKINTTINTNTNSGIFYRDEYNNPLCPRCVTEQYPANHGLIMEVLDEEAIECDSCGEDILPCGEEDEEI